MYFLIWSQTWLDQEKSFKDIKCFETIDSKIHRENVIGTCLDLNTYGKCDIAVPRYQSSAVLIIYPWDYSSGSIVEHLSCMSHFGVGVFELQMQKTLVFKIDKFNVRSTAKHLWMSCSTAVSTEHLSRFEAL